MGESRNHQFIMAGIKVGILTEDDLVLEHMEVFRCGFEGEADLFLEIGQVEGIDNSGVDQPDAKGITWYVDALGISHGFIRLYGTKQFAATLEMNPDWTRGFVGYQGNVEQLLYEIDRLVGIAFYYTAARLAGVGVHSAAIDFEGNGIIFTAPSETGKTTQANLWKQYKGAKVINVDRPLLRTIDTVPMVCGIPWSGSQRVYLNHCSPLAAIVIIEQAAENKIKRISFSEALPKLIPRCYLPYVNQKLMEQALGNLEAIIELVPIYVLGCRPDEEAVELVYNTVFGK